jgi:predicted transcriptional regulator
MRPLSLEKIYEVLFVLKSPTTLEEVMEKCGFTAARAREILKQLVDMSFVEVDDGYYKLSENGKKFLEAFEEGDYAKMHTVLMNFKLYKEFFERLLANKSVKISQLCKELNLNMLILDVLVRLMRKLNIKVICNEEECYLERDFIEYYIFEKELINEYIEAIRSFNIPRLYVPIPYLREKVKSRVKISDTAFDEMFRMFVYKYIGKVVLSPAPVTVKKERGFKLGGKIEYYYVYISPEVIA